MATFAFGAVVWAGTSMWLNRRVTFADRSAAAEGADGRFVVLAYDRIVTAPDRRRIGRERLREHLIALRDAGWQPVTLREVQRAYRGAPLPARPVLITFDEGYLGTYEGADPLLRELRWPAVMFLLTDRQEARDVSFLFWDRLRRMAQSGLWEIASGDPLRAGAGGSVPDDPPGVTLIEARLGMPAAPAWAPRGVEPIVALGVPADAERAAPHWLGFTDDPVGANDPDADPLRIARLRVDPGWTAAELVRRMSLAVAGPQAEPVGSAWVEGQGASTLDGGTLHLDGQPRSEAWIPATRWVDDWVLEVTVRLSAGEFWVVQPGPSPGHEWRVGGTSEAVYVEARSPGRPPHVLAKGARFGDRAQPHRLRVIKRGGGVWATFDGRPLSATPVALPEHARGRTGLVVYGHRGRAAALLDGIVLKGLPYRVHVVSAAPDAREVAALTRGADAIAALSPPFARFEGASFREYGFDRDLFRILGKRYAWDLLPTVAVASAAPPSSAASAWMAELPERVRREGWSGVRLDTRAVAPGVKEAWDASAHELAASLRRARLRFVRVAS
jgi:hypothetical protein